MIGKTGGKTGGKTDMKTSGESGGNPKLVLLYCPFWMSMKSVQNWSKL